MFCVYKKKTVLFIFSKDASEVVRRSMHVLKALLLKKRTLPFCLYIFLLFSVEVSFRWNIFFALACTDVFVYLIQTTAMSEKPFKDCGPHGKKSSTTNGFQNLWCWQQGKKIYKSERNLNGTDIRWRMHLQSSMLGRIYSWKVFGLLSVLCDSLQRKVKKNPWLPWITELFVGEEVQAKHRPKI